MKLIDDWRTVLLKAWSMRLWTLSIVLELAGHVLPLFQDVIPAETFRWLSQIAAIAGMVARLMPQKAISGHR